MKNSIIFAAVLLVFSLVSCEETDDVSVVYDVPTDFEGYVNTFFDLANKRSLVLEEGNLIIRFEENLESDGSPICGQAKGTLTGDQQHLILVDAQCLAWRYSDRSKEILLFHELGHAFLERTHDNKVFPSGEYKSIMYGESWDILRYYTEDLSKREYYINELFDPLEPAPEWAQLTESKE